MIRREEKRLALAFGRALALALATPACTANELVNPLDGSAADSTVADGNMVVGTEGGSDGGMANACARTSYTPVVMDLCADFWRMPCGIPDASPRDNCFLSIDDCNQVCEGFFYNCRTIDDSCNDGSVVLDHDGGLQIECSWCIGGPGRAPYGLAHATFDRSLGGWFARAAYMEAASVHAFRTLRRELRALRAPASLVSAARRAERDEVRHARITARIAKRHGGRTLAPRVRAPRKRSIEAIAIENMAQGCVGETYAALEACHQAEHAPDAIRDDMRTIARDEIRHAALAWAVARWLDTRLGPAARSRVAAAKDEAIRNLGRDPVVDGAGLPAPEARRAMIEELRRALW